MNVNTIPTVIVWIATGAIFAGAIWPTTTTPARAVIIRIVLGIFMILLGIVGIFLPVIQAWLCFLLAYVLFFPGSAMTVKITARIEPKMPRAIAFLRELGIGVRTEE